MFLYEVIFFLCKAKNMNECKLVNRFTVGFAA